MNELFKMYFHDIMDKISANGRIVKYYHENVDFYKVSEKYLSGKEHPRTILRNHFQNQFMRMAYFHL